MTTLQPIYWQVDSALDAGRIISKIIFHDVILLLFSVFVGYVGNYRSDIQSLHRNKTDTLAIYVGKYVFEPSEWRANRIQRAWHLCDRQEHYSDGKVDCLLFSIVGTLYVKFTWVSSLTNNAQRSFNGDRI